MKPRYRYNWNTGNWTRVGTKKNQMIPANEINIDIALTTIGSVKRAEDCGGVDGRGGDNEPRSPLSEKEPGKYQIRSLWRVLF